jgi:uncharacterized protein (DUF1330 family)
MSNATRHEILVGLHVTDNESYSNYRSAMTPLLNSVNGAFRYDFTIAETLVDDSTPPINRLFVISFPDQAAKEALFADPTYLAAKAKHFDSSVDMVNIMATYEHGGGTP